MKKPASPTHIWFNGQVIPWKDALVHVWTELAARGANVFEGIRCYKQEKGGYQLLSLEEHIKRLYQSAKILHILPPFACEQIIDGIKELIKTLSPQEHFYVRPTIYVEYGRYGEIDGDFKNGAYIVAFPVPRHKNTFQGANCCVSTWLRSNDLCMSPLVKAGSAYQSFKLPMIEAKNRGCDEAILLNIHHYVAETTGSAVFIVRNGIVITPPLSAGILESITRKNVIKLLSREMKIDVIERNIPRTELYLAEEIFLAGTLSEITPVLNVDNISIGSGQIGTITKTIQKIYFDICEGRKEDKYTWMTPLTFS